MNKESIYAVELNGRHVVIFDGVCNFCNSTVNFIIQHDMDGVFCFTPMQSVFAKELAGQYYINNVGIDTLLLIKNNTVYTRSDAAIEIANNLSGYWYLLNVFKVVPRPVRDFLYKLLAKNRYALFGKSDNCIVPTPAVASRFVGI